MARKRKTAPGPLRQVKPGDRWRCIECGTWKFTGEFSSKQLDIVIKDPLLQPDLCFMKCITCADYKEPKIQCEASCGETKPASAFSKTSRSAQIWKCEACIAMEGLHVPLLPVIEKKDLETMSLAHDPATVLADSYMNEPAAHPEHSFWNHAIAAAASSCGIDMSDHASDVASLGRSATPVPLAPDRSFNRWGPSGRHDGWKIRSDASSTASQATESTALSELEDSGAPRYGQLRRTTSSSVAWSSASTSQGRDSAWPALGSSRTSSVTASSTSDTAWVSKARANPGDKKRGSGWGAQ